MNESGVYVKWILVMSKRGMIHARWIDAHSSGSLSPDYFSSSFVLSCVVHSTLRRGNIIQNTMCVILFFSHAHKNPFSKRIADWYCSVWYMHATNTTKNQAKLLSETKSMEFFFSCRRLSGYSTALYVHILKSVFVVC